MTDTPYIHNTPNVFVKAHKGVQIELSPDGKVLWLNVDGICAARVMIDSHVPIQFEHPAVPTLTVIQNGRVSR